MQFGDDISKAFIFSWFHFFSLYLAIEEFSCFPLETDLGANKKVVCYHKVAMLISETLNPPRDTALR